MRVLREVRGKTKTFLSGNKAWCNLRSVMVVAEQPADQWADLEGTHNELKVVKG